MNDRRARTSSKQTINRDSVVGAVLAGGGSVRMGSPKHALVMPDGRTMIEHVVAALRGVCGEVVVLGPDDVLPDMRHVHDVRADAGPLAGIESLLMSGASSQYLVCPCDVPLITADVLRRLLINANVPATVFRVDGRDRLESLPMRVSADAVAAARRCLDTGRRSVRAFIEAAGFEIVAIDADHARQLTNINTPEQYAAICRQA